MFLCFQIILSNTCRVKSQSITRLTSGEVSIVGAPPCRVSDCLTPQRLEMEHGQNFCTMFESSAFFLFMCFLLHLILFHLFLCFFANIRRDREASFPSPVIQRQKRKRLCWLFLPSGLLAGVHFCLFFSVCVQKHLNANFDVAFDGASNFRHFFIFLLKKSCDIVYQTPSASSTFYPPNITVGKNVARASHWRRNDGLRLHLAD